MSFESQSKNNERSDAVDLLRVAWSDAVDLVRAVCKSSMQLNIVSARGTSLTFDVITTNAAVRQRVSSVQNMVFD